MPIRLCPSCWMELNVAAQSADRTVKCPRCSTPIPPQLPLAEEVDAPPAQTPPKPQKRRGGRPLVTVLALLVCAGAAFTVYWFAIKDKGKADETVEKTNRRVNEANYKTLRINMTRAQVEEVLGPGKPVSADELANSLGPEGQPTAQEWGPKAREGKVIAWRNNDNFLLVCFYPDAGPNGKVQASAWEPRVRFGAARDGSVDDRTYLELYSKLDPTRPVEVAAEDLVRQYRDNPATADARYKDKVITVEGKFRNIRTAPLFTEANLEGLPPPPDKPEGYKVWCHLTPEAARALSAVNRGQTVKLRGKCVGVNDTVVNLFDCQVESIDGDTSLRTTAAGLISDYASDAATADARYKGKEVTLAGAQVERVEADGTLIVGAPPSKGPKKKEAPPVTLRIRVTPASEHKPLFHPIKPGDRITLRGECGGLSDGHVLLLRSRPVK